MARRFSTPTEIERFIKELIEKMTLEEKISQLCSIPSTKLLDENNEISYEKMSQYLQNGIGQITRLAGSRDINPKKVAELANRIQKFLVEETRLKIPAIIHEECLSGLMASKATVFPQAIGLASTWNPTLIKKMTTVIRRQMRAIGAHQGLSPVLDVARDPRWGRVEETYGEDPYLVASMGKAYIEGLQGDDLSNGVIATPKHFAGYSFSEGGRNVAPVHVSKRELREVFLFPFEVAVRCANAVSLMNAYHEIDGIPCATSRELFTDILRREWGFKGFVVSDYGSIEQLYSFHKVAVDKRDAAIQALEAGIDVELPEMVCYWKPLLEAIDEGLISETVLDQAVSRVLRAKVLLGLFDNPFVDTENVLNVFDTPEDRRLALEIARESIVLLKNDNILPLRKDIKSIAVIGPNASTTRGLLGDYTFAVHLALNYDTTPTVSILEGIKNKVSPNTKVYYAKGCGIADTSTEGFKEALEVAEKAEVIIAVVGEVSGLGDRGITGEGRDRASLDLPGVQKEMLKQLFKTGKPVILVLVNGRPLAIGDIVDKCAAVIEAWLPGEEGDNAVADVIFGDYNPSGKLPISFPKSVGQIPVYYNRKVSSFRNYVFQDSKPLYPFGFGLSYTTFEYRNLIIKPEKVNVGGKIEILFEIENTGDLEGAEVAQLYIQDEFASVTRPVKELKGFAKVYLKPGEKKTVKFILYMEQLAFYDRFMRLIVEPGRFNVMIGSSSEDIRLKGHFEIIGEPKVIYRRNKLLTTVKIF